MAQNSLAPAEPQESPLPPEPWENIAGAEKFQTLSAEDKIAVLENWTTAASTFAVAVGEDEEEVRGKLDAFRTSTLEQLKAASVPTDTSFGDLARRVPAGISEASADTIAGGFKVAGDAASIPGRIAIDVEEAKGSAALGTAIEEMGTPEGSAAYKEYLGKRKKARGMREQLKAVQSVDKSDAQGFFGAATSFFRDVAERSRADFGVDEARDEQFLSKVASGVGSLAPVIASGPGAPAAAAALLGEAGRKDAEKHGANAQVQDGAFYANAAVGLVSEALLGIPALLRSAKAAKVPAETFKQFATNAAAQVFRGSVREGTQEGLEAALSNFIASDIAAYDVDRKLSSGVAEAALVGAAIGAPVSGVVQIAADVDSQAARKQNVKALGDTLARLRKDETIDPAKRAEIESKIWQGVGEPETAEALKAAVDEYAAASTLAEEATAEASTLASAGMSEAAKAKQEQALAAMKAAEIALSQPPEIAPSAEVLTPPSESLSSPAPASQNPETLTVPEQSVSAPITAATPAPVVSTDPPVAATPATPEAPQPEAAQPEAAEIRQPENAEATPADPTLAPEKEATPVLADEATEGTGSTDVLPIDTESVVPAPAPALSEDDYRPIADAVRDNPKKTDPVPPSEGERAKIFAVYTKLSAETGNTSVPIADLLEQSGYTPETAEKGKGAIAAMFRGGDVVSFSSRDWSLSDERTRAWGTRQRDGQTPDLAVRLDPSKAPAVKPAATPPPEATDGEISQIGPRVFNIGDAWDWVRENSPAPSPFNPEQVRSLIESGQRNVNAEYAGGADVNIPGLAIERNGSLELIDGFHRAKRAMDEGKPFSVYIVPPDAAPQKAGVKKALWDLSINAFETAEEIQDALDTIADLSPSDQLVVLKEVGVGEWKEFAPHIESLKQKINSARDAKAPAVQTTLAGQTDTNSKPAITPAPSPATVGEFTNLTAEKPLTSKEVQSAQEKADNKVKASKNQSRSSLLTPDVRDPDKAWVDATAQGLVEVLADKGVVLSDEQILKLQNKVDKALATIAKRANGSAEAKEAGQAEVQSALLRNAAETGDPFVTTNAKGERVSYAVGLIARREIGNAERKLGREAKGEGADLALQNATSSEVSATSGVNPGNRVDTSSTDERESLLSSLVPKLQGIMQEFGASYTHPEITASKADRIRAAGLVIDNIVKASTGEGLGTEVVDTRGKKGIAHVLAADPDFIAAVKEQVFDTLAAQVREQADSSILGDIVDRWTQQERRESYKTAAFLVRSGYPVEMALKVLPEDDASSAAERIAKYRVADGSKALADAIAAKSKNPFVRALAEGLQRSLGSLSLPVVADPTLPLRLGYQGAFVQGGLGIGERIGINPVRNSDEEFELTAVHELSHAIGTHKVTAFLQGRYADLSEADLQTLQELDALRAAVLMHPAVPQQIRDLALVQDRRSLMQQFGQLASENKALGNYYSLLDLHEFTSGSLTSKSFQSFLADIEIEGLAPAPKATGVWSKVKELLRTLVFGRKLSEKSALALAFDRTVDLMSTPVSRTQQSEGSFGDIALSKEEQADQLEFLNGVAKAKGYASPQELLSEDPAAFLEAATEYRHEHPVILSDGSVFGEHSEDAPFVASREAKLGPMQGQAHPLSEPANPEPFSPLVYTDSSRKRTESLARAKQGLSAPVRRVLDERTYIAGQNAADVEKANEFIEANGGAEAAFDLARRGGPETFGLPDTQRILVAAAAAKRVSLAYDLLIESQIANGNLSAGDKMLAEHYRERSTEMLRWVGEQLSTSAQTLQIGNAVADLFSPRAAAETLYKGPIKAAQEKVLSKDKGATKIRKAVDVSKEKAAKQTLKTLKDLLDKAARIGTPAQVAAQQDKEAEEQAIREQAALQQVFGWFDKLTDARFYIAQGSGATVMQDIEEAVRKSVSVSVVGQIRKLVGTDALLKGDGSFLEKIEKEVEAIANEQISSRLRLLQEGKPELTREDMLSQLGDVFSRVEPAALAFARAQEAIREYAETQPDDFRYALAASGVLAAQFDVAAVGAMQNIVRKSVDLPRVIRASLQDRYASLASLQADIRAANPSMSDAQAASLAEAVEKVYAAEVDKAATAALEALLVKDARLKELAGKPKDRKSTIAKIVEHVNLGAFSEERFYNSISEMFGLPAYDDTFATSVEFRTRELQKLPENSLQRNEAMQILMRDIAKEAHRTSTGLKKVSHLLDVGASIWTASVLSGPPTQIVNTVFSGVNVALESTIQAAGYALASRAAGNKGTTKQFFSDLFSAYGAVAGHKDTGKVLSSPVLLEAYTAATRGTTRFKSDKFENLAILEEFGFRGDLPSGLADTFAWLGTNYASLLKGVGRVMLAADSANSLIAADAKKLMAARFLAIEEGLTPEQAEAKVQELLDTNGSARAAATVQAQQEQEEGQFGTLGGLKPGSAKYKLRSFDIEARKLRRIEQLIEQQTTSQEQRDAARDFAAFATFNSDPQGVLGLMLGTLGWINNKLGISKPILPFPRTLANMVNASLNYSPIGFMRARNWSASKVIAAGVSATGRDGEMIHKYVAPNIDKYSQEYYAMNTRAAIGTAAVTTLFLAVKSMLDDEDEKRANGGIPDAPFFDITARGPSDYRVAQQLRASGGWVENTIKIGDARLKYTDVPGFNIILGAIGAYADARRYNGLSEEDTEDALAIASLSMANVLIDKNMLSGMSDFFTAIQNPDQRGISAMKKLFSSYAGGFGSPQALRWVQQSFGVLPERSTSKGWLLSMSPVSFLHDKPAINLLGEPVEMFPWEATTRRFGSLDKVIKPHPIFTPLVEAELFLPAPSKATKVADVQNGKPVQRTMSQEEYYDFSVAYGTALKEHLTEAQVARYVAQASVPGNREAVQERLTTRLGSHARERARAAIERKLRASRN